MISFISRVSVVEIVHEVSCYRLVLMGVASHWGVIFSTALLCFERSILPSLVACKWAELPPTTDMSVSMAITVVIGSHLLSWFTAYTSLTPTFGDGSKSETPCKDFLVRPESSPINTMAWCMVITAVLSLVSSVITITSLRKRRSLRGINIMSPQDVIRLDPFIRPPDELGNAPVPNPLNAVQAAPEEPGPDVNENAEVWKQRSQGELQGSTSDSDTNSNTITNSSQSTSGAQPHNADDFYDYEQRRHRAQSPPPGNVTHNIPGNQQRSHTAHAPPPGGDTHSFYDEEQRRHRAQSPPPGHVSRPKTPPIPSSDQEQLHANIPHRPLSALEVPPETPPLLARNQEQIRVPVPHRPTRAMEAPPQNDAIGPGANIFVLPAIYLGLVFPHRQSDKNKPRFSFTQTEHTRELSWPLPSFVHMHSEAERLKKVDYTTCVTNLLFVFMYTPIACYLLLMSSDSTLNFTDQSFSSFIFMLLLEASFDSYFTFFGIQFIK